MKIDISFDDANISDVKAANLLSKYGFTGTFYMPSTQVAGTILLSLKEVFEGIVKKGHLIGGHTVSHPMDLKSVKADDQLKFEIQNNKFLCDLLMAKAGFPPTTKFCYPRGRHDARVRAAVKAAGFLEARTTRVLHISNDTGDPLQTPTSVHMFAREEYKGEHWTVVAKKLFDKARVTPDSFFSLWGHSIELTRQNDWGKFEELLSYMRATVDSSTVADGATGV